MGQVKDIADRIKQRRLELELSYRELEELTGITASTLQRYESGFISKLPIDKLYTIAKGLRVDPGYLMGWEDKEGNLDVESLPKKEKLNYEEFMEQSKFFFNDENVSEEDKELFFKSLQEIFLDSLKRTKKWGIQWEKISN